MPGGPGAGGRHAGCLQAGRRRSGSRPGGAPAGRWEGMPWRGTVRVRDWIDECAGGASAGCRRCRVVTGPQRGFTSPLPPVPALLPATLAGVARCAVGAGPAGRPAGRQPEQRAVPGGVAQPGAAATAARAVDWRHGRHAQVRTRGMVAVCVCVCVCVCVFGGGGAEARWQQRGDPLAAVCTS